MSLTLLHRNYSQHRITDRELVAGLRNALDRKYGRVLAAARREWERSFAGSDPSDACVSVRISGATRPQLPRPGSHYLVY